ncbi:MAG TPA: hypothetical protein EYH56_01940 [Nanoarchaeota archaeon]|nr:hypothetical protein [Nanoarchaeota archaeon]
MFKEIFEWSYKIGNIIRKKDEKLLKSLIFDIRGEETPGRFLEKLCNKLSEYKTNKNIALDISINPLLLKEVWHGDKFYYLKAAILTGFINALSTRGEENE